MKNKEEFRKEFISIRNKISNKLEKSNIIMEKIIEEELYKNAKVIALYKSLPSEVDTNKLIEYSVQKGKTVVLPKAFCNELKFYKISIDETLIKSKFGVEEPKGLDENFVDKKDIDLVIVPGVCFDKCKNRMGFGKGYYDRFLAGTNLNTFGICFEEQIAKEVPVDSNDIKMDKIITDGKCYE